MEIVAQFNWVDIFVIILLFRTGYIAIKFGLPVEIFKLLGVVFAIYLSLHYYTSTANSISKGLSTKQSPSEFLDFVVFLALTICGYLFFMVVRETFSRFIKMEAVPSLSKWGGLALGIIRGFLLSGLIIFAMVIPSTSYFKNSIKDSYSGRRLFAVAPNTYKWLWNNLFSKFILSEKYNTDIDMIEKGFYQK